MQKILRFLGLIAVIGAFAIVVSQNSSARAKGGGETQGSTPVATASNSGYSNNVLVLLSQYFCHVQLDLIDRAKSIGREDLVDPVIRANCKANLWLQTPDQQAKTIAMFEIEKYRGKDPLWMEVARTPSLVKSLLKVSSPVDAKVEGFLDEVWRPIHDQDKEFEEQLYNSAEWKNAKSKHEQNVLHYERLKEYRVTHPLPPLAERRAATGARYLKAIEHTAKLLTPEQAKEYRMLLEKFRASMAEAFPAAAK